MTDLVKFRI